MIIHILKQTQVGTVRFKLNKICRDIYLSFRRKLCRVGGCGVDGVSWVFYWESLVGGVWAWVDFGLLGGQGVLISGVRFVDMVGRLVFGRGEAW